MRIRLGIDVGGTFTDLVLLEIESGAVLHTKVLTTAPDPAVGVVTAIEKALAEHGIAATAIADLRHGTTIATNAMLERRGAPTALVTTKGFRDVLEIGRQIRPSLFDWFADKPEPLVPRRRRFELNERVSAGGEVTRAPADDEVAAVVERVAATGVEAVAVCFLFSFLRPEHEERVAAALRERLPNTAISISARVLPEYREYERTSTTVANAYLTPVVARYVSSLERSVGELGLASKLQLLQSNGGLAGAASARERAVTTALSGPAGGVTAAAYLARLAGSPDVISMDMGGTSCDVCLIRGGQSTWTVESRIGGLPVRIPMLNVNAVGAGGGSLIWIDTGGALRVGPRSAGGNPGPAGYGRGGSEPTVTDAHAVLGTVRPEYFADKGITFDVDASRRALERIGGAFGLDVRSTALGALRVTNHNLAQAIRAVSVRKGYDPRDFAIVAFGGAGPLHACLVAEELGSERVVFPAAAGVFSALGAALADFRFDFVRGLPRSLAQLDSGELEGVFVALEGEGTERLQSLDVMDRRLDRSVDLRYVGQSYEINVATRSGESLVVVVERFHQLHAEAYGYSSLDEPVELVNVRVAAIGVTSKPPLGTNTAGATGGSVPEPRHRGPGPDRAGGEVEYAFYDRSGLPGRAEIAGPAVLLDDSSTGLVPPGWVALIDEYGSAVLHLEQK